jgi:hypothetical protein
MLREHVAELWPRRRDEKGMDQAKGRAMMDSDTSLCNMQ